MKRVSVAGVVIMVGLLSAGRAGAAVDLGEYRGAVSDLSVSVGRGLTLANDELEAVRTESLTLGIDLTPGRLRLSVPFEKFDVDTRGRARACVCRRSRGSAASRRQSHRDRRGARGSLCGS